MSITPDRKQELISEFGTTAGDTGSPDVQIAITNARLMALGQRPTGRQ